ncbi:MAG: Tim44 domain-containing protein [Burkholderiaceae bacterium]|nr:Tim44 domain-containing protein [Burkholderiaceae bacterium]
MNRFIRLFAVLAAAFAVLAATMPDAEARRLGGGRSFGKQSGFASKRAVTPPAKPAAGSQGAAQPSRNRWLGPIAGLAAGLGLAALASHLGLGEGFANLLMIALIVFAALALFRVFAARRAGAPGLAGAGAGAAGGVQQAMTRRESLASGAMPGAAAGSAAGAGAAQWSIPPDLDVDAFLHTAKVHFVRLQAANDAGNLDDLREFTTPEVFAELKLEIAGRAEAQNRTDVVTLEAELLGVETTPSEYVASVRYSGMIREAEGAAAEPFDEVWNLTKPLQGEAGWLLAGIQQDGFAH